MVSFRWTPPLPPSPPALGTLEKLEDSLPSPSSTLYGDGCPVSGRWSSTPPVCPSCESTCTTDFMLWQCGCHRFEQQMPNVQSRNNVSMHPAAGVQNRPLYTSISTAQYINKSTCTSASHQQKPFALLTCDKRCVGMTAHLYYICVLHNLSEAMSRIYSSYGIDAEAWHWASRGLRPILSCIACYTTTKNLVSGSRVTEPRLHCKLAS